MAEIIRINESADAPATPSLPQNIEAEAALLGALMIDNRLVEDVQLRLKPHHFFEPLHGRIYEAILRMTDKNMVANPVTLKPMFEADEAMREVGGPSYLAQLTGSGAAVIGARDFAAQIYDLALLRALVGVGRDMVEGAMDTSEDVAPLEQIERAETELYRVAEQGGNEGKVKSFGEATQAGARAGREGAQFGRAPQSGVTTGLDGINAKIGGLHKSDLSILAGRPGMGKTSLATNIAFACAQRFVRDQEDGIDPAKSAGRAGRLLQPRNVGRPARHAHPRRAVEHLFRKPAHGQDQPAGVPPAGARRGRAVRRCRSTSTTRPGLTIAALRARARRLKRQKGIGMVVVDYLQLLSGLGQGRRTTIASRKFPRSAAGSKQLAKELDLPVMALSQLSRAVEQREDKKPMLSDLRESGSIEQDADIVMFVYREDYYVAAKEPKRPMDGDDAKIYEAHETWQRDMERVYGMAELIVAKQRHGATGKVRMRFDARVTKFSDPDRRRPHARAARLARPGVSAGRASRPRRNGRTDIRRSRPHCR